MKRLAIITTHPIQYNAPLFKLLTKRKNIQIKVFYTWEQSHEKVYDKKFGKEIKWDIPLLEDYDFTFVKNISKNPSSRTFKGVVNPSLKKEIEDWKADAILVFGWNHHSHFKAMRFFKRKISVYFRGDSTLIDEVFGYKTLLRRIWLKFVYRFVDKVFYVGKNNKEYFLKHGLKENQLFFAPHAIDNERFAGMKHKYNEKANVWKQKLGIKENEIVFLFVGKFETKKNPLLLVDVAIFFPKHKFIFVGNGELEQDMKQKAGKNVLFLPFQNQSKMPIVYRLADVFVLPSQGPAETWGLAVNEAMTCEKAILVSNKVGCALDLVENGKNGFIFESNKIDDLKEKISIIDSDNINLFGKKSYDIIKNWSFENIANVFENIINE